jgi:hypothetical protein
MTPYTKFRDPQILLSKFKDLDDTTGQVQGPVVNFALLFQLIECTALLAMGADEF